MQPSGNLTMLLPGRIGWRNNGVHPVFLGLRKADTQGGKRDAQGDDSGRRMTVEEPQYQPKETKNDCHRNGGAVVAQAGRSDLAEEVVVCRVLSGLSHSQVTAQRGNRKHRRQQEEPDTDQTRAHQVDHREFKQPDQEWQKRIVQRGQPGKPEDKADIEHPNKENTHQHYSQLQPTDDCDQVGLPQEGAVFYPAPEQLQRERLNHTQNSEDDGGQ